MQADQLPKYHRMIRPNRSLTRGTLGVVLGAYLLTEVGIGVAFFLKGAWLVLPFAGLEILAIGIVLYFLSRHNRDYELVVVDDRHLKITRQMGRQRSYHEFQRYWTKVQLRSGSAEWYPSRLLVGSHGEFVEIAASMDEDNRRALARDLKQIIQR